jgi:DNA-binding NarL/FixJ family response regulator
MSVLSEPLAGKSARADLPRLIVSAAEASIQSRVASTLKGSGPHSLKQAESAAAILEMELDEKAIVVLGCDVDLARDIATLRRLCRELRGPSVVAISPVTTAAGVRRALDSGAEALVFEPELEATLAVAITAVASGQSVVPQKVRASVERPALSHRERQVLGYVSGGLTNSQIAERLFLSESTIKSHLSSVFVKLGVRSRREAAALFRELERSVEADVASNGATA